MDLRRQGAGSVDVPGSPQYPAEIMAVDEVHKFAWRGSCMKPIDVERFLVDNQNNFLPWIHFSLVSERLILVVVSAGECGWLHDG